MLTWQFTEHISVPSVQQINGIIHLNLCDAGQIRLHMASVFIRNSEPTGPSTKDSNVMKTYQSTMVPHHPTQETTHITTSGIMNEKYNPCS